jgi:hypothetical protein
MNVFKCMFCLVQKIQFDKLMNEILNFLISFTIIIVKMPAILSQKYQR